MLSRNNLAGQEPGWDPHPPRRSQVHIKRNSKTGTWVVKKFAPRPGRPKPKTLRAHTANVASGAMKLHFCPDPTKPTAFPTLKEKARQEMQREERLKKKATVVDTLSPEGWPILNKMRQALIRKEIDGTLEDLEETLLANLEIAASKFAAKNSPVNTDRLAEIRRQLLEDDE